MVSRIEIGVDKFPGRLDAFGERADAEVRITLTVPSRIVSLTVEEARALAARLSEVAE